MQLVNIDKNKTDYLLSLIRGGNPMTASQQAALVLRLSGPAVMAQLSSIIMQYIDATMVGSLGANASASIGLVSTTTWLFGGFRESPCHIAAVFDFGRSVRYCGGGYRHCHKRPFAILVGWRCCNLRGFVGIFPDLRFVFAIVPNVCVVRRNVAKQRQYAYSEHFKHFDVFIGRGFQFLSDFPNP